MFLFFKSELMHFFAERRAGGQHTHAHKRLYITRTKLRINFVFIRGEGGGLEFGATAIQTARQRKGNISTGDDRGSFKKKLRERETHDIPNNFSSR